MTIITKTKTYHINENFSLFIECYQSKPDFIPMWKYGLINIKKNTLSCITSHLSARPNAKKCIQRLSGMIYLNKYK